MTVEEFEAGEGQLIVVYGWAETGDIIDAQGAWEFIASDAQERATHGWRIVSTAGLPLRQMDAILYSGQYATQAAIAVVYAQR